MLICSAFRIIFLALQIKHSEFTVTEAIVLQPALTGLQQCFYMAGLTAAPRHMFLYSLCISISKHAAMGLVNDVHYKKLMFDF